MILKITFNDNDFTQVLEEYFEEPIFGNIIDMVTRAVEKKNTELQEIYLKKYKRADILRRKCNYDDGLNKEEQVEYISLLKESILEFIRTKYPEDLEYLEDELKITVQKSVTDHWENGEVIYYFTMHDVCIRM